MYNYELEMIKDIKNYIKNDSELDIYEVIYNRDEVEENLYDDLWDMDEITGNGVDGYTDNDTCKKWVLEVENAALCLSALSDFCVSAETIGQKFLEENYIYFDCTIRCSLLGRCISSALDEVIDEYEKEI